MQEKLKMTYEVMMQLLSEDSNCAFEVFYNLYYADVYKYTYYFSKNHEVCKEIVSDVFFSIWKSRKKIKEIANINNYLFIVVRNEATRYAKHNQADLISIEEINTDNNYSRSADYELLSEEIDQILEKTIDMLPEKCRLIFTLIRQENMKYAEVAKLLSLKESTVRVQMKIAIEKIATTMKPYFPNLELIVTFALLFN